MGLSIGESVSMKTLKHGLYTLSSLKEVNDYLFQFNTLNLISRLSGEPLRNEDLQKKFLKDLLKEVWSTISWDAKNVKEGVYPESVRLRRSLYQKTVGFLGILKDYPSVIKRRKENKVLVEKEDSDHLPDYFKRAFHFQSDGYLSIESAKRYDQQVDILFTGTADIMRRSFFPTAISYFKERNQKPSEILEIAAGTGRGSQMLREVFPESNFTLNDLSADYLQFAKKSFDSNEVKTHNSAAEDMVGVESNHFDLSFQIFLFHELPYETRRAVLNEQVRVTKPGGLVVFVDSLQLHDKPEWSEILNDFPRRYHEPFYRNYIKDNIEELFNENDELEIIESHSLLMAKCIVAKKLTPA
jgi:ubiquinone/menaquinone biosynthesis C-methylase UbiE